MAQTVTVRLPEELVHTLEHIAQDVDRSRSYLIKKAIEQYISEYADYQIALERLNDVTDEIVSSNEMRKLLDN